jgi:hypothetical protein
MSKAYAPGKSAQIPVFALGEAAGKFDPIQRPEPAFADNRPETVAQRELAAAINGSPRVLQQKAFFDSVQNSPCVIAQRKRMEGLFGGQAQRREMEELPGEPETAQRIVAEPTVSRRESSPGSPAQFAGPEPEPNNTGLPDGLKSGIESLSSMSLDHVKVHYNSTQPVQLNAQADAQGSDIQVATGQEQHLPHEAWHIVRQAQGRVRPTRQMKDGVPVNEDARLGHEADVMGQRAAAAVVVQKQKARPDPLPRSAEGQLDLHAGADIEVQRRHSVQRKVFVGGVEIPPDEVVSSSRSEKAGLDVPERKTADVRLGEEARSAEEFKYHNWRNAVLGTRDYTGATIGVEQELVGDHKIYSKTRGVIGNVLKAGVILVEFTTDMGSNDEYTIELRTKPAEKEDPVAMRNRLEATRVMVSAIETAGKTREGVVTQDLGGFHIEILHDHTIRSDGPGGIGFGNQASMGVQTDELASGTGDSALLLRYAKWFDPGFAARLPTPGLLEADKSARVYGMVASVIKFLAEIVRKVGDTSLKEEGDIGFPVVSPEIKNQWEVLPRTPPWEWLDALQPSDKAAVQKQLRADFTTEKFDKGAFLHISLKQALAGHPVPPATIGGKHSSIFEFRSVPPELRKYLYGEEAIPPAVAKKVDPGILKLLTDARHFKRPKDEDSDEDEDDDSFD